jgi:hypothetical protein
MWERLQLYPVLSKPWTNSHWNVSNVIKSLGISYFQIHMKIHIREKWYVQKQCSKAFTHPSLLQYCELAHPGEKPYVCKQHRKVFTSCSSFWYSEKIHYGRNTMLMNSVWKPSLFPVLFEHVNKLTWERSLSIGKLSFPVSNFLLKT